MKNYSKINLSWFFVLEWWSLMKINNLRLYWSFQQSWLICDFQNWLHKSAWFLQTWWFVFLSYNQYEIKFHQNWSHYVFEFSIREERFYTTQIIASRLKYLRSHIVSLTMTWFWSYATSFFFIICEIMIRTKQKYFERVSKLQYHWIRC